MLSPQASKLISYLCKESLVSWICQLVYSIWPDLDRAVHVTVTATLPLTPKSHVFFPEVGVDLRRQG